MDEDCPAKTSLLLTRAATLDGVCPDSVLRPRFVAVLGAVEGCSPPRRLQVQEEHCTELAEQSAVLIALLCKLPACLASQVTEVQVSRHALPV